MYGIFTYIYHEFVVQLGGGEKKHFFSEKKSLFGPGFLGWIFSGVKTRNSRKVEA